MTDPKIPVAVISSSFCHSAKLRDELSREFPNSIFNARNRSLSEPEIIELCKQAQGIIIGVEPVGEAMLSALPELKIIAKYGVGLDNLDREAMDRHGVALGWTGGINKRSVAEMTLCFMLGLCRNIFAGGFTLKQTIWRKNGGTQLTGKTIGIVGCGHIGTEVVHLLTPFNCHILMNDILEKSDFCKAMGIIQVSKDELLDQSDIVSLHVPQTELTQKMVDENFLRKMKKTAFLINTSRGLIVDQLALKAALQKNTIAGAALDVFEEEPPTDSEFLALPNLMVTPHTGGNAIEAVEAMGRKAISHLVHFFQNKGNLKAATASTS